MKININNESFKHFQSFTVNLIYNSIAGSFQLVGKEDFFPENLTYPLVEILTDDNQKLLTGTILNQPTTITPYPDSITASGYGLAGVLEDCPVPVSSYPLQSDKLSLKQIVEKFIEPFGLNADSDILDIWNQQIEKSIANPTESIKSYFQKLASQRGLILTNDPDGKIIFTKIDVANLPTVANLIEGKPGFENAVLNKNGQSMHSEITIIKQASSKNPDAGQSTINNPYISVFRPTTKILNSGTIFNTETAARIELGNELRNISLIFETTKLILPGSLVNVQTEKVNSIDFFVEETEIKGTVSKIRYTNKCVLPDVYSLDPVKKLL
jgi:prophage tail gpP-like protein